jgi:hypothetical protein
MTDDDRPFSEEESARLRAYPTPPRDLEQRVVAALHEDRPAAAGRHNSRTKLLAIGASALLAFALGRWTASPPVVERGDYLLLVQAGPGDDRLSASVVSQRVEEFSAWARDLRAKGVVTSAEKLEDGGEVISSGHTAPLTDADRSIGGFFLIHASTPEEAASIARGAPNLRHGGRIVLRRLDHRRR